MNKKLIRSGIFCFSLLVAGWCEAANYNEAIVFVDSLSDSGNYFAQFGGVSKQPYETENVPSEPYAIGGHHFTNGATWVEKLTKKLHIPKSGLPSEVSPGRFRNYAVGRSRARDVLLDSVFSEVNLTTQVDNFLADARISLDVKSLRLVKAFGQKIVFFLSVVTRYEWSLNKPSPQHSSPTFTCETQLRPIDKWVNDVGATIEHELNYCIEDIARQINKVLTKQPPTSVNGFSDLDV